MKTYFMLSVIITLLLGIMGCSGSGVNFEPSSVNQLKIDATTKEQIISLFGKAISDETVLLGNLKSEILTYDYRKGPGFSDRFNIKYVYLEIIDNKLNGFVYSNSFENQLTDFNSDILDKLVPNKTTRDEIISLVGSKYGELKLPSNLLKQAMSDEFTKSIPQGAAWALAYSYRYYHAINERYISRYKVLLVYLDSNGILLDKYYAEKDIK